MILRLLIVCCLALLGVQSAPGADYAVLKGKTLDLEGRGVAGVEIFAYNSAKVRRPADYISRRSGADGAYRMELPAGKYWLVARLRTGKEFGPLAPGAKHSGEAVETELEPGREEALDFTVADVAEMAQKQRKPDDGSVSVAGRVRDRQGRGVAGFYVYVRSVRDASGIPEYVSAWSDRSGSYRLQLPPGRYYFGTAAVFPPPPGGDLAELSLASAGREGCDFTVDTPEGTPGPTEPDPE